MIKWGILGVGNIAKRFAASLQHEPNSILKAISCSNPEKAIFFDHSFTVEKIYIGHEKLLLDPEIDAIYLDLPHGFHKEWAVRALKSGKAVLCEKPAVVAAAEMLEIINAAKESHQIIDGIIIERICRIKTTRPKGGLLQGYKPVLPTAPKDAGLHFVQAILSLPLLLPP